MPQRELAMRLFVERSYVSHAESGRMLPARRFWELADRELGANGSLVALFERALLVDRVSDHDARGPGGPADASRSDAVGLGQVPDAGSVSEFGPSSRRRTAAILEQMSEQNRATRLRYVDSPEPGGSVRRFLTRATHRVFVLKGAAGLGKTRFVWELAQQLRSDVYVQLHWMSTLDLTSSSLTAVSRSCE
jgi:hypothetical protein